MGRAKDMRLSERLRRLDDNAGSRSIVSLSDQVGWWWNLAVGFVLIIAATVVLLFGSSRSDVIAAYSFGLGATLIGVLLTLGRSRPPRR
jgi:uncharacterized membrane protein HdeD (DUF308 family)